jgi:MFS transporter, DHA3 family, macrolide efflux protein
MNTNQPDIKDWKLNFLPLWIAQLVSMLGSMLAQYAMIWWMTLESGSAAVMAAASLFALLPGAILGPFAGTIVDRFSRKWIMILSDGFIALMVVILIVLFRLDVVQYWSVFILMGIRSIGGTLHSSALNASIRLMVPEDQLTRVSGLNQTVMGIIGIIAAPIAALLIANPALDFASIISIDVITAMIAICSITLVMVPQPAAKENQLTPALFFQETREAFPFVWQWKGLRNLFILLAVFSFFFMPINALETLFVLQDLQQDMAVFSVIESVFGIGFMLGGVILSIWGGFKRRIMTVLIALLGMGASLLFHALAPGQSWWMAVVGMILFGLFFPLMNGPVYAILQSGIEPGMQGRVFALQGSLNNLVSVLALLLVGLFAETGCVRWILVITSAGMIGIAIWGLLNSALRNIEDDRQAA